MTYCAAGVIYPPRRANFWIYERLVNHHGKLKAFVIMSSCYNAFSIGTNNVANAVGPLAGAGIIGILPGLFFAGIVFGLGAFLFQGSLKTAGEKIVPLGLMSSAIICLVSGTLMIIASVCGVPQSFVMIKLAALFAVGSLKSGPEMTFNDRLVKNTFYTWMFNPVITMGLSYGFARLILT